MGEWCDDGGNCADGGSCADEGCRLIKASII